MDPARPFRLGARRRGDRLAARLTPALPSAAPAAAAGAFTIGLRSALDDATLRAAGAHYATAPTHGEKRLDQAWSIERDLRTVRTLDTRSDHRVLVVDVT